MRSQAALHCHCTACLVDANGEYDRFGLGAFRFESYVHRYEVLLALTPEVVGRMAWGGGLKYQLRGYFRGNFTDCVDLRAIARHSQMGDASYSRSLKES